MRIVLNRRGATLPLTIIVLAIMGVAVAVSYARLSSERRTTADGQAQTDAFAVAQSGLNRFLSNLNGKPAAAGPWPVTATYNDLPGGSARVDMMQIRDSTTSLLPCGVCDYLAGDGHGSQALRLAFAGGRAHGCAPTPCGRRRRSTSTRPSPVFRA